ncbi:MAG: hypothetical protein NUW37_09185 [Planctomycetes bacterium]|nr:hypothetical protein [Planctomycetota bacterium]
MNEETGNIGNLIRGLENFRTRYDAKQNLLAIGKDVVPELTSYLENGTNRQAKWSAIAILGELRAEESLKAISSCLLEPDLTSAARDAISKITGLSEDRIERPAVRENFETVESLVDKAIDKERVAKFSIEGGFDLVFSLSAKEPGKDRRLQHVKVTFEEYKDQPEELITVYSECCPASKNLDRWALKQNAKLHHGALAVMRIRGREELVMKSCLYRSSCTPELLGKTIKAICRNADQIEKEIAKEDTR